MNEQFEEFLSKAPPQFKQGFQLLDSADYDRAASIFLQLREFHRSNRELYRFSSIMAAYCLQLSDENEKALDCISEEFDDYTELDYWYYGFTKIFANDQLNRMEEAEISARFFAMQVPFFYGVVQAATASAILCGILKQRIASTYRKDGKPILPTEESWSIGRSKCIAAMTQYAIIASSIGELPSQENIETFKIIWAMSCQFNLKPSELGFGGFPKVVPVLSNYVDLSSGRMACKGLERLFNFAQECKNDGRRADAEFYYAKACEIDHPTDRPFMAYVRYQRGLNIYNMHEFEMMGMDRVVPNADGGLVFARDREITQGQYKAIAKIQKLWNSYLNIVDALSPDELKHANELFPVQRIANAIRVDKIMRVENV